MRLTHRNIHLFGKFDRAFDLVFFFLMDKKETGLAGLIYKELFWYSYCLLRNPDLWKLDQIASFFSSFRWDSFTCFHFCTIIFPLSMPMAYILLLASTQYQDQSLFYCF